MSNETSNENLAADYGWPARSLIIVFGLIPAGLITVGAIFLLPNFGMLHPDPEQAISASAKLQHYLTFSAPIAGFAAMLFAFVAPAAERLRFRAIIVAGLVISVLSSGVCFYLLTHDLWFYLGHWIRGTRLPFDFVEKRLLGTAIWFVVFGGMISVGLALMRRLLRKPALAAGQ